MRTQKLPPEYSKQASKYISGLESKVKLRLKNGIEKIPKGNIRPYIGTPYLRLRIGDYRLLFKWLSDEQILIHYIGIRGDVYKKGV